MSDPPVDPRTETDSGRDAHRARPRPAASDDRQVARSDESLGMPTVQIPQVPPPAPGAAAATPPPVPLGRGSGTAPGWNVGDLQEPPPSVTAPPVDQRTTQYVPVTEYQVETEYQAEAQYFPDDYGLVPEPYGEPVLPRKPRVRKVSRVLRAVDAWSVFKVSIVFYLAMYAICLIAGVLLWNVAYSTGTIDNLSNFFESFGWKSFEFKGGEIYHNAWILGLFLVVGLTGLNVVLATLFNLISDLVGGIRMTVLEEEVMIRRIDLPEDEPAPATSPLVPDPARQSGRRWRGRRRPSRSR